MSDMNRVFHPIGLALCHDETRYDFQFIFESLKIVIELLGLEFEYKEIALQADAADSITKGFESVFGQQYKRGINILKFFMTVIETN